MAVAKTHVSSCLVFVVLCDLQKTIYCLDSFFCVALLTLPLLFTVVPKLLKQCLKAHLPITVLLVSSNTSGCVSAAIISYGFQDVTAL